MKDPLLRKKMINNNDNSMDGNLENVTQDQDQFAILGIDSDSPFKRNEELLLGIDSDSPFKRNEEIRLKIQTPENNEANSPLRVTILQENSYYSDGDKDDADFGRSPPVPGEVGTRGSFLGKQLSKRLSRRQSLSISLSDLRPEKPDGLARTITWGMMNSIENSLHSFRGTSGEPYTCQICFETKLLGTESFSLKKCGHTFCTECIRAYIHSKVKEAQVFPRCFFIEHSSRREEEEKPEKCCDTEIDPEDIEKLLETDELVEKYRNFKFSKQHKNARECPYCSHLQEGDPQNPAMICETCKKQYCFFHSKAHEGSTCTAYERQIHQENAQNLSYIEKVSKPCPGCGMPSIKGGGCNQMKCSNCGTHFCWLCLKVVDAGTFPAHFQWWNVGGCPNLQMQESDQSPSKQTQAILKVVSIFQLLILGPIAAIMTLLTSILCCCVLFVMEGPCIQRLEGIFSCWGNICMCVIGIPLLIVLAPIWCPIFCCLQMCKKDKGPGNMNEIEGFVDLSAIGADNQAKEGKLKMLDIEEGTEKD